MRSRQINKNNQYFLEIPLRFSLRSGINKKARYKPLFDNKLHSYTHFLNYFMFRGKFLFVLNSFYFSVTSILHLFDSPDYVNVLSPEQNNKISFFKISSQAQRSLLFMMFFIFNVFGSFNLLFSLSLKKKKKKRGKKRGNNFVMDYVYLNPNQRFFKTIQIFKSICTLIKKREFSHRISLGFIKTFVKTKHSLLYKFQKYVLKFVIRNFLQK